MGQQGVAARDETTAEELGEVERLDVAEGLAGTEGPDWEGTMEFLRQEWTDQAIRDRPYSLDGVVASRGAGVVGQ